MNPENEIFEGCNNNQTESELKMEPFKIFEGCNNNQTESSLNTETFEPCNNNQTKKGRGGARPNSGAKPKGIKTKVVRIDAMLFPLVMTLQWELRDGNLSRDDIRELMNRADKTFVDNSRHDNAELFAKIISLQIENQELKAKGSGIDEKLRKRLIHFCHPDKNPDREETANELTQELNGLAK